MNLSKAVKLAREKAGIQQNHLAAKCEISAEYLSKIENGKKTPTIKLIKKIGKELKVSPYGLVLLAMEDTDVKPEKRKLFNALKPVLDKLTNVLFLEEMLNESIAELTFEDLNLDVLLKNTYKSIDSIDLKIGTEKLIDSELDEKKGGTKHYSVDNLPENFPKIKANKTLTCA